MRAKLLPLLAILGLAACEVTASRSPILLRITGPQLSVGKEDRGVYQINAHPGLYNCEFVMRIELRGGSNQRFIEWMGATARVYDRASNLIGSNNLFPHEVAGIMRGGTSSYTGGGRLRTYSNQDFDSHLWGIGADQLPFTFDITFAYHDPVVNITDTIRYSSTCVADLD
jgi:hypothetical protein